MNKKTTIPQLIIIAILAGISIATTVHLCIKGFSSFNDFLSALISLIILLSVLSAGIYIKNGQTKKVASYYKHFLSFLALLFFANLLKPILAGNTMGIIIHAIMVICIVVLMVGKDLGEQKTWLIFGIMTALQVVIIIAAIVSGHPDRIINNVIEILLILSCGFMIKSKYEDKKERGSK